MALACLARTRIQEPTDGDVTECLPSHHLCSHSSAGLLVVPKCMIRKYDHVVHKFTSELRCTNIPQQISLTSGYSIDAVCAIPQHPQMCV